tara:strand:+ start:196 stop:1218 length:1023 start_codon:yes stop_codon:yes gene_type:complete
MNKIIAEYIWVDGVEPTPSLRSKIKVLNNLENFPKVFPCKADQLNLPMWGFDGSSTQQAEGKDSDCVLKPVRVYRDVTRENGILVLCEVLLPDGSVHPSNTRHALEKEQINFISQKPLVGIEQEYTIYQNDKPLGWPLEGEPAPQGDYYCGRNAGEDLMHEHLSVCLEAGVGIAGTNAEVMLGQWEYQVGANDPLRVSDDLWIARWLLEKISQNFGYTISLDPKPVDGDWNGAGCHTNFSTEAMRSDNGDLVIHKAIKKLEEKHEEHIAIYGENNNKRLTGDHETCDINTFKWGVSDRGASVRIPWQVSVDGKGYLEDRRPASNIDPYLVCKKLLTTICS